MPRRREIFDGALALPTAERARLARELLYSLDGEATEAPAAVARAWDEVIARRVGELKAGTAKTEPWSAVEARLKRRIRARSRRRASR